MLLLILVFSSLFLGGATGLILRKKNKFIPVTFNSVLLISGVFLLGIIFVFGSFNTIQDRFNRKNWPVASAEIFKSELAGTRAFHPEISFRYIVNDQIYTSTSDLHTPGFGAKSTRRDTAEKLLQLYPVGSTIQIHYNPENPHEAFIRTGPYWSDYMKLCIQVLLLAGGIAGFILLAGQLKF